MSEFAKFLTPPDGTLQASERLYFVTNRIKSYEYTSKWSDSGDFRLTMPADKDIIRKIKFDDIILYDGDHLIVNDIDINDGILTLSGSDLKSILRRRKSAVSNGNYDTVEGTSALCILHYLNNNFISPVDTIRQIPMEFVGNSVTGLADEAYMARLEDCGDIIKNLCDNAQIGYTIKGDRQKFRFELLQGVDRSAGQSDRPRVIFSASRRNVTNEKFSNSSSNYYNAIYAMGNSVITCEYRDTSSIPSGLGRKECVVNIDDSDISAIHLQAIEAVKDNIITHGYDVTPTFDGYGKDYQLGDIVSVKDRYTNNIFSGIISEVQKSYSEQEKSIKISIGQGKKKLFTRIINNMISGVQQRR